ncbi:hypothetical protein ABOM_009580 [Aspergillus bombycis]|uniref:Uncharacterized protein n=1 Tax=Aspergillus bombycis TaxID=109264 RepID=A0A1F7ZT34_9EURO|nr:hypothetical protein ABOM_009580 [Aspergillus bombycis]OGM42614.1 hypothetical protein ABOM_009580 [Aspergillus bombycis]
MSLSASDRLRRSRSTRSIRRSHQMSVSNEPFDPEIAKQHATVAASLAMRRSTERSSTDSQRSYDRLGGPGSMAVPQRRNRPSGDTEISDTVLTATLTQSRSDSEENNNSQLSPAALPPIREFGGLDGRNSSLPSSYRRLRKSRSMFAGGQRYSRMSSGAHSRLYDYVTLDKAQVPEVPNPGGALKRSLSFLRGSHPTVNATHHMRSHEAAIQLARSQFLQSSVDSTDQCRASSIHRPKREHKPFRKTFRSNSGDSASGMDASSTQSSVDSSRHAMSQDKTRSLSSSIKRGIKKVLGLSKPVADTSLVQAPPVGQAQSQVLSTTSKDDNYPAGNDRNLICADRLTGSDRSQIVRSIRSSESLATSRSRVTSWADSTVANTIVTRKTGEQSHLCIIDEQGDLGPNPSLLTPSNSPTQDFSSTSEPAMLEHSIDSQRLYAALMKRIGQNHAQHTEEEIFLGQVREHRAIPTRASSLYPRSSRQTIRRVPSNESFTTPRSYATAPGGTVTPQKRLTMLGSQSALDGDTRSINVIESPTLDISNSPSIYSRTTSGNSPSTKQHSDKPRSSGSVDELGVATIFESQRSAYRSPKRTPGLPESQIQPQPSADWQQWMQSQMARIENLTPTKKHYKEDAQIYDDEANMPRQCLSRGLGGDNDTSTSRQNDSDQDHLFASREPITTCKIWTRSNFSRPFSRSPSVRTVVTASKEQGLATAPLFSIHTSGPPSSDGSSFTVGRIRTRLDQHASLPMQSRPINRPWMPESPTPKREARELSRRLALSGKYGESSVKWPQAQDTGPVPFRLSRHRDSTRFNNENIRADTRHGNVNERCPLSQGTYSPMSSKRMVELFLNSRRRQMGMEMSDDSAPDGAFL